MHRREAATAKRNPDYVSRNAKVRDRYDPERMKPNQFKTRERKTEREAPRVGPASKPMMGVRTTKARYMDKELRDVVEAIFDRSMARQYRLDYGDVSFDKLMLLARFFFEKQVFFSTETKAAIALVKIYRSLGAVSHLTLYAFRTEVYKLRGDEARMRALLNDIGPGLLPIAYVNKIVGYDKSGKSIVQKVFLHKIPVNRLREAQLGFEQRQLAKANQLNGPNGSFTGTDDHDIDENAKGKLITLLRENMPAEHRADAHTFLQEETVMHGPDHLPVFEATVTLLIGYNWSSITVISSSNTKKAALRLSYHHLLNRAREMFATLNGSHGSFTNTDDHKGGSADNRDVKKRRVLNSRGTGGGSKVKNDTSGPKPEHLCKFEGCYAPSKYDTFCGRHYDKCCEPGCSTKRPKKTKTSNWKCTKHFDAVAWRATKEKHVKKNPIEEESQPAPSNTGKVDINVVAILQAKLAESAERRAYLHALHLVKQQEEEKVRMMHLRAAQLAERMRIIEQRREQAIIERYNRLNAATTIQQAYRRHRISIKSLARETIASNPIFLNWVTRFVMPRRAFKLMLMERVRRRKRNCFRLIVHRHPGPLVPLNLPPEDSWFVGWTFPAAETPIPQWAIDEFEHLTYVDDPKLMAAERYAELARYSERCVSVGNHATYPVEGWCPGNDVWRLMHYRSITLPIRNPSRPVSIPNLPAFGATNTRYKKYVPTTISIARAGLNQNSVVAEVLARYPEDHLSVFACGGGLISAFVAIGAAKYFDIADVHSSIGAFIKSKVALDPYYDTSCGVSFKDAYEFASSLSLGLAVYRFRGGVYDNVYFRKAAEGWNWVRIVLNPDNTFSLLHDQHATDQGVHVTDDIFRSERVNPYLPLEGLRPSKGLRRMLPFFRTKVSLGDVLHNETDDDVRHLEQRRDRIVAQQTYRELTSRHEFLGFHIGTKKRLILETDFNRGRKNVEQLLATGGNLAGAKLSLGCSREVNTDDSIPHAILGTSKAIDYYAAVCERPVVVRPGEIVAYNKPVNGCALKRLNNIGNNQKLGKSSKTVNHIISIQKLPPPKHNIPVATSPAGVVRHSSGIFGPGSIPVTEPLSIMQAFSLRGMNKDLSLRDEESLEKFVRFSISFLDQFIDQTPLRPEPVEPDCLEVFREHYRGKRPQTNITRIGNDYLAYLSGKRDRKFIRNSAFVKFENSYKASESSEDSVKPRLIMTMSDLMLVECVPLLLLIESWYESPFAQFQVKHMNSSEIADVVSEFMDRPHNVTDYSSFESSIDPYLRRLEEHVLRRLCERNGWTNAWDAYQRHAAGGRILEAHGVKMWIVTRCSGDFWTSFGNGIVNVCLVAYSYHIKNLPGPVRVIAEGDDGVTEQGVMDSAELAKLGMEFSTAEKGSYMGDTDFLRSRWIGNKRYLNVGRCLSVFWVKNGAKLRTSKQKFILRCMGASLYHLSPGHPVLTAIVNRIGKVTAGCNRFKSVGKFYNPWNGSVLDDASSYPRDVIVDESMRTSVELGAPSFPGISRADQRLLERMFESDETMYVGDVFREYEDAAGYCSSSECLDTIQDELRPTDNLRALMALFSSVLKQKPLWVG